MDFSGTEAIPFLTAILGLDINKLTASGLGLRSSLDDDLTSSYAYALYYFNETLFVLYWSKSQRAATVAY